MCFDFCFNFIYDFCNIFLQEYVEFVNFNGLKMINFNNIKCFSYFLVNNIVVFDFVDWRLKGYVIKVKDQVIVMI